MSSMTIVDIEKNPSILQRLCKIFEMFAKKSLLKNCAKICKQLISYVHRESETFWLNTTEGIFITNSLMHTTDYPTQ